MALTPFTTGGFGGGMMGDPFFDNIDRTINRAINRAMGGAGFGGFGGMDMMPFTTTAATAPTGGAMMPWASVAGAHPMDVHETDTDFQVVADAPGYSPEDINVEVQDGTISIRGEKKMEKEEKDKEGRTWRSERFVRRFHRSFVLPDNVKDDAIDANLDKGVLRITIPKSEEAKPKSKRIGVKHGGGAEKITMGGEKGGAQMPSAGTAATTGGGATE